MTEKLYYEDGRRFAFEAVVTGCEPSGAGFAVVLDKTCFYPEGGGQKADTGFLNDVRVTHTRERGDEVLHETDGPLPVGAVVRGLVDGAPRESRMRQHTGEHIVSGLAHELFGLNNVGFHMGEEVVTLDMDGELRPEDLARIERAANEAVWKDLPVVCRYPEAEELAAMEYRSKKALTGAVRIVEVPGFDRCACCGTHVRTTGEIGAIKLLTAQRHRGGMRVTMVCGDKALEDYGRKNDAVYAVGALLSAKPEEIALAVERLLAENAGLKQELARQKELVFETRLAAATGDGPLTLTEAGLSSGDLRLFCLRAAEKAPLAAVFSQGEGDAVKFACAADGLDVRPLCKALCAAFAGQGGGKPALVQGNLRGAPEEMAAMARAWFAERQ